MQRNQRINCNVENCTHNSGEACCILDSITVVNNMAAPTAHYCYDYENQVLK